MKNNVCYQGDCLEVMKGIQDNSIDMILVDPPYGIDFQSAWRTDKTQWKPKILNDKKPFTKWTYDAYRIMKDNTGLLCFTRWDTEQQFRDALTKSGFKCKQQIIWDKVVHGMGDLKGDFASQHENIIFAVKGRFIFKGKRPKSIFRTQRVNPEKLVHPNEKPIDLLEDLIKAVSVEDDIIFDCFAGSGSLAMAAKNTNRNFVLIEQDEKYCEVIKNRVGCDIIKPTDKDTDYKEPIFNIEHKPLVSLQKEVNKRQVCPDCSCYMIDGICVYCSKDVE